MSNSRKLILALCFLFSGAAGLILEVVWSKDLSYILGNTLYAVSTVVAAYMGGLGIGSLLAARWAERVRRPLQLYAVLETLIGLCGISLHHLLGSTWPLFGLLYRSLPAGGAFLLARFAVVFLLLLIPTILMGMTLPVVIGAFARRLKNYDGEAALLYGLNTLGAVLGTLGAGFVLIPAVGLAHSALIAGLTDLAIAAMISLLSRRITPEPGDRPDRPSEGDRGWTPRQKWIASIYAVSGMIALILEVAWFRLLGLTLGPSVYAFASMLGVYLAGIGLGSALISPWMRRIRFSGLMTMVIMEAALGAFTLLQLFFFNSLPGLHARIFLSAAPFFHARAFDFSLLALSSLVVFVPCLILGALFPTALRAAREAGRELAAERHVGRVYLWNTAGGIVGSLLAGFWLLPHLGLWPTLILAGLGSLLLAALLLISAPHPRATTRSLYAAGIMAGGLVLALLAPSWNTALFNLGLYQKTYASVPPSAQADKEQLIYYQEGLNAPVAVYRGYGNATLYISGKPDASLAPADLYTQSFLGHLPVSLCGQPRKVAMIGYGSGMTAAAILAHPEVERLDIIEIERAVIDASPYFEAANLNPFRDSRTRLILDDGRVHLSYTNERYDVVTSEPSNPWMAGIANLFTTDFYSEVRHHLTPGGVFAQWIQDYDISKDSFSGILASISEAFPHLLLFRPTPGDFIVLASSKPLAVPWEIFRSRFMMPRVRESYRRIGLTDPAQLTFFFQGPERTLRENARGAAFKNTDDNAILEYRLPRELLILRGTDRPKAILGPALARAGASNRIEGLRQLLPDLPLAECLRASVLYPQEISPNPLLGRGSSDLWRETREDLLRGMVEELRQSDQGRLADELTSLDRSADRRRQAGERVTDQLRVISRGGSTADEAAFTSAVEAAPELPFAWMMLGQYLLSVSELDGAEESYQRALEKAVDPLYQECLLGLAQIALQRGSTEDAARLGEEAVAWNPYYPKFQLWLATLFLDHDDPTGAERVIARGLKFNPGDRGLMALQPRAR